MRRREFIASLGGMWWASFSARARAQTAAKTPVIGFLRRAELIQAEFRAFEAALAELGWKNGHNVKIVQRYAGGDLDKLRRFAEELVGSGVDVLVVDGTRTALIAEEITSVIPIVFAIAEPSRLRVDSLRRPGSNVTGVSTFQADLSPKRIELLTETIPRLVRPAVLHNPTNPGTDAAGVQALAQPLGIEVRLFAVTRPDEWPARFTEIAAYQPQALLQLGDATFASRPAEIVALALEHRLPAMYVEREFVEAGGLMSYGVSNREQWKRAATYVDRILRGGKASELPIEQPTKLELLVNRNTARELGITIPTSIQVLADEVIE